MTLTTRILPQAEWSRLSGTLLGEACKTCDPNSRMLVIEDDGAIVACGALMPVWHLEGIWIDSRYRKRVSAGRKLLTGIRAVLNELQIAEVFSMARSVEGMGLCKRFGRALQLDCAHFSITPRTTSWE